MMHVSPLRWPDAWPRASALPQKIGTFNEYGKQLTVRLAAGRVREQLERKCFDADYIIVSTNLETRGYAPLEPRREPRDCAVAVYWKAGKSGFRVMAADQYDTVANNLAAIAAILKAMHVIESHGGSPILERAFIGLTAPVLSEFNTAFAEAKESNE